MSDEAGLLGAQHLGAQQYVELTTFRRTGAPVSTPVWIAPDGSDLLIVTVDDTGKTKRLAHTARIELRPCDMRGNVADGAPRFVARAQVRRDPESLARVKQAIGAKYGWWYRAFTLFDPILTRLPGRKARAAIVVTDVAPAPTT